jgi:hypothetical protein
VLSQIMLPPLLMCMTSLWMNDPFFKLPCLNWNNFVQNWSVENTETGNVLTIKINCCHKISWRWQTRQQTRKVEYAHSFWHNLSLNIFKYEKYWLNFPSFNKHFTFTITLTLTKIAFCVQKSISWWSKSQKYGSLLWLLTLLLLLL